MKTLILIVCALFLTQNGLTQIPQDGLEIFYSKMNQFDNLPDDISWYEGINTGGILPMTDRFGNADCAFQFPGGEVSYFLVQGGPSVSIDPDSTFSLSLWMTGGSLDGGDLETFILKRGQNPNNFADNASYVLGLYDLNKVTGFSYQGVWMPDSIAPAWNENWTDWHHVVMIFEPGNWRMYFDHQLISMGVGPEYQIQNHPGDLFIGYAFEGGLDDIAFYNKALSDNEIDQLFNAPAQCGVVGLNGNAEQLTLDIWPNPCTDELFIDLPAEGVESYEVYDANGRRVLMGQLLQTERATVNVSSLASGKYDLMLLNDIQAIGHGQFIKD